MVFCLFGDQYRLWNFILRYVWKLVCFTSPTRRHEICILATAQACL